MPSPGLLTTWQYAVEVLATAAFALSGILEGARKRLDVVGVGVVASLAAFGGGTLRDLLLDRRPLFWVEHVEFLWIVLALAVLSVLFLRGRHFGLTERAMLWPDAVGLGLFCAAGTQVSLDMEMPLLVAAVLGVITAVFGGILRDMVCNEIPRVLRDHRPYAICAFLGAWVLIGLQVGLGMDERSSLLIAAGFASATRLLAVRFDWALPAWRL
jgi:uncharacterized membrane protein YeiH